MTAMNRRQALMSSASLTLGAQAAAQTSLPPAAAPAHLTATASASFATQPWGASGAFDAGPYRVERVVFPSGGVDVVGNLFVPAATPPRGAVALIGPVAFVKEQAPLQYASRLAREGYAALIFDPRFHGESGGVPRRYESRRAKVEDLRAAVGFLASRPDVDARRIHLLGICQGVNWALEAAADEARVRAVAAVAGHYLMPETAMLYLGTAQKVDERIAHARRAREAFDRGEAPEYIPIVSLTDPDALLTARPIHDFYYRWADRGPFAAHTGLWENRITRMSEAEIWSHRIDEVLKRLERPMLMVHSDRAASGPQIPRRLFDVAGARDKQAVWLDGRNQIQFYQDPMTIDMVVPHLLAFFDRHGTRG